MKNNNVKVIWILLLFIIALGGIFLFKIINSKSSKYYKSDLLYLIDSAENKNNYEVEYTTNNKTYNKKYLNKQLKVQSTEFGTIVYVDFNENKKTMINNDKKVAIIDKLSPVADNFHENYLPNDLQEIIKDPNCKIIKEEKLLDRNTVVLKYSGSKKIEDWFSNTSETVNYTAQIWIDKETGFLLQTLLKSGSHQEKVTYNLKLNTVTAEDVTVPNISQYTVINRFDKKN